jgi:hypothetical protein
MKFYTDIGGGHIDIRSFSKFIKHVIATAVE